MLLKARTSGNEDMHRFLGIADGIARAQSRKIIFTTNLPNITDIDPALIRPGRCFAVKLICAASTPEEAQVLARRICGDDSEKLRARAARRSRRWEESRARWRRSIARVRQLDSVPYFRLQPVEDDVLAFARIDFEAPAVSLRLRYRFAAIQPTTGVRRSSGVSEARAHVAVARPHERLQAGRRRRATASVSMLPGRRLRLRALQVEFEIRWSAESRAAPRT